MIALLDTSHDLAEAEAEIGCPVGQLLTPLTRYRLREPDRPWAIDNGAFAELDTKALMKLLKREDHHKENCLWVTVPDIVGSAQRTSEVFDLWAPQLAGWKLAYACQDGQENVRIPWGDIAAVFIGGSTNFKCGPAGACAAGALTAALAVLVVCLAANPRFINLDNAAKLRFRLDQRRANFVAHGMRRLIRAEAHDALNLKRAGALLASQHQVRDAKPITQRLIRVLKDRARDHRETIAGVWRALVALPFERHRVDRENALGAVISDSRTTRAAHAIGPPTSLQISLTGRFVWEHLLKLTRRHLGYWLGTTHEILPSLGQDRPSMELPTSQVRDNRPNKTSEG